MPPQALLNKLSLVAGLLASVVQQVLSLALTVVLQQSPSDGWASLSQHELIAGLGLLSQQAFSIDFASVSQQELSLVLTLLSGHVLVTDSALPCFLSAD